MAKLKLKKYDASTQGGGGHQEPRATFGNKGLISINKAAMKLMKLKETDKLSFFEDEDNEGDWFMAKDKDGLKFRITEGGSMVANSSQICRDLCASLLKEPGTSLRCPIEEKSVMQDGLELFPIFTKVHMSNAQIAKR